MTRRRGYCQKMDTGAEIVVLVLVIVPLAVVAYVFVWAARKDGEADRALQRRLGIRRKTRLGR
jgi:cbb3-type cytochrome oxidase subunit 3